MKKPSLKRIRISAATVRERYLKPLFERLPKADADRLEAILPLFTNENLESPLQACLSSLFPDRPASDAQAAFRAFRGRLKQAARAGRMALSLEVDTRKSLPPSQRPCWFEAPDDTADQVARFSETSADLDPSIRIESQAFPTTGEALETGKLPVHFFVSSDEKDRRLANELLDELDILFRGSKHYAYETWTRENILVGEDREKEITNALAQAGLGLILVSPAYLGSTREGNDLGRLQRHQSKPIIPVVLRDFPEDRIDLRGLDGKRLFRFDSGHGTPRSYEDCRNNGRLRQAFVNRLFEKIERRLDRLGRPGSASPQESRRLQKEILAKSCPISDEDARHLAERETDLFVDGDAAPVSLDLKDLQEQTIERLASQGQNALELLNSWALDEKGPLFAAVLGEYGIGKTTTLKQFTHRMLDRRKKGEAVPLPIFIDLRSYSQTIHEGKVPELREFLQEVFQHAWKSSHPVSIKPEDVLRLVREEGAILIFDGLDEKLVHLDDSQARAFVRELWSALPPQSFRREAAGDGAKNPASPPAQPDGKRVGKLLFSCRSHYFKTLRDQGSMLRGEDRDGVRAADYKACILLPFNEDQVRSYLTQSLDGADRAEAALELFASIHNLKDLSRRPYLLSLISQQIGKLEARRANGEIVLGVTLYETVVEEWLNRDEGKHYLQKDDKRRLMEDLAAAMWREGAREWEWGQVREWLGKRLAGDTVLRAQYLGDAAKLAILEEDFRTATFVLRPDTSIDRFRFAHTSLHEFFLACHLARALREQRPEGWDLPMPSVESLDFLGQLLAIERRAERRQVCLGTLKSLLAQYRQGATEAAFRYRLLAGERGLPEPEPGPVDLHGADLTGWTIRGKGEQRRLDLRGANFAGARLVESRWQWVELSGADFVGAQVARAEFEQVSASTLNVEEADLVGTSWRHCQVEQLTGRAEWHGAAWVYSVVNPEDLGTDFGARGSLSLCEAPGTGGAASEWGIGANLGGDRGQAVPAPKHRLRLPSLAHEQTRLETVWGHGSIVTGCAWSPDGKRILSGSSDHTLKVWDAASANCLLALKGHDRSVSACAWSHDGKRILSGSYDNTLKVWDAVSGEELMTLALGPNGETAGLDLRNGRILSASPGAWRFVAWHFVDPASGLPRILPLEHFGPVPTSA